MIAKGFRVYTKADRNHKIIKDWRLVEAGTCTDSAKATSALLQDLVDKKLCNCKWNDRIEYNYNYDGSGTITVYWHVTYPGEGVYKWKKEYDVLDRVVL